MDDTISRQAAIKAVRKLYINEPKINNDYAYNMGIDEADDAIRELPSAERRGKKKVYYHGENTFSYVCDQCNMSIDGKDAFCKWCGARMEE